MGCVGGLIIGLVAEYFTSHTYVPTRELATACKSGTAVNIILGMALGYKSCLVPVFVLAASIFVSFSLCDLYGIALAALGMLATLAYGLTIDSFSPVSDDVWHRRGGGVQSGGSSQGQCAGCNWQRDGGYRQALRHQFGRRRRTD